MRLSSILDVAAHTRDAFGRRVRFRLYRNVLHDCEVSALHYDTRSIRREVASRQGRSALGSANANDGGSSGGHGGSDNDGSGGHGGNGGSGGGNSHEGSGQIVFFALRGTQVNGEQFIQDAVVAGATIIVCASRGACRRAAKTKGITIIRCRQPQLLLSLFAHALYGKPSEKLQVIGVTGTDGKSTSAYFTYQLLRICAIRCGIISTVMLDTGNGIAQNPLHLTTPSAPQLHKALHDMRQAGYTHVVIETSSHSLSDKTARVAHVYYNAALITNITSEHLDFHRTRRRYKAAKARLLCMLRPSPLPSPAPSSALSPSSVPTPSFVLEPPLGAAPCVSHVPYAPHALSAADSATQRYLQRYWRKCKNCVDPRINKKAPPIRQLIDYRVEQSDSIAAASTRHHKGQPGPSSVRATNAKTIRAVVNEHTIDGITLQITAKSRTSNNEEENILEKTVACLPFCGLHNAENAFGAMYITHLLTGHSLTKVASFAKQITLPSGRLQQVSDPKYHSYRVFIDYAHTTASLAAILQLFRPLTHGRLVVLFGSAGMRDRKKRSRMGEVAAKYADVVYLTSEDPRAESPQTIANEIMHGITRSTVPQPRVKIILDREDAIATAISEMQPKDTLLLLGKGHEQSMIFENKEVAWNEAMVAQRYLKKMRGHNHSN